MSSPPKGDSRRCRRNKIIPPERQPLCGRNKIKTSERGVAIVVRKPIKKNQNNPLVKEGVVMVVCREVEDVGMEVRVGGGNTSQKKTKPS